MGVLKKLSGFELHTNCNKKGLMDIRIENLSYFLLSKNKKES